jgi:hypothetical protein
MTLRLGDLSVDARYDTWSRVIERIYREQVNQAWSRYMFRLLRAVFTTNPRLSDEGGFIFQWMVDNYVDAALMLIRRELDRQAGTENLRNLLFDMIEHPMVATRGRYRSKWGKDGALDRWFADRVFDRFKPIRVAENPDADHIDPDVIRADLDRVGASAEQLREYAERTRAHRTPERRINTAGMTFKALHDAIGDLRNVVGKYYALLTLRSIAQWEPVPQYDTFEAFTKPWLVDRAAVQQAAKEPGGE